MTHREKVAHLNEDLVRRGYKPNASAPLLFRVMWNAGSTVPPPLFLGFGRHAWLVFSFLFDFYGAPLGLMVWGCCWLAGRPFTAADAVWLVVVPAAGYAGLMAVLIATTTRRAAARLDLPAWERYPGPSATEPAAGVDRALPAGHPPDRRDNGG
jgi:Family of unknown function (DUF6404)